MANIPSLYAQIYILFAKYLWHCTHVPQQIDLGTLTAQYKNVWGETWDTKLFQQLFSFTDKVKSVNSWNKKKYFWHCFKNIHTSPGSPATSSPSPSFPLGESFPLSGPTAHLHLIWTSLLHPVSPSVFSISIPLTSPSHNHLIQNTPSL